MLQHTDQLLSADTGKQFRYYLKVSNAEGSAISRVAAFIIADVPDKPTVIPWKVQDYSDNTSMLVRIQPLTELQKGGSEIISYQIQVDDGQAGEFSIVLGENAEDDPNLISLETEIKLNNLL